MGNNNSGQLGDGTYASRVSPVQVASSVIACSAGASHSLFVKSDGTLWAMGDNSYGQLGDGTTTSRYTPVQVASGVVACSAGGKLSGKLSLFVKSDGTLWGMGLNNQGQLGDGTLTSRQNPVQVGGGLAQLPAMPIGLTASDGTFPRGVLLSWNPVIGASHYEVWRNSSSDLAGATLLADNVPDPLCGDFTAALATTYYYWVKAVNFAGTSDFSASDSGFNPLIAPTVATQPVAQWIVSGQSVSLLTSGTGSPAPSYRWQCSTNGGNDWIDIANDTTYSGVNTAALTVGNATTAMRGHQFRCIISNQVGSSVTSPVTLTVNPVMVVTTLAGQSFSALPMAPEMPRNSIIPSASPLTVPAIYMWPTAAITRSAK